MQEGIGNNATEKISNSNLDCIVPYYIDNITLRNVTYSGRSIICTNYIVYNLQQDIDNSKAA